MGNGDEIMFSYWFCRVWGPRASQLRRDQRIHLEDVARLIDVDPSWLELAEKGRTEGIPFEVVKLYTQAIGLTLEDAIPLPADDDNSPPAKLARLVREHRRLLGMTYGLLRQRLAECYTIANVVEAEAGTLPFSLQATKEILDALAVPDSERQNLVS